MLPSLNKLIGITYFGTDTRILLDPMSLTVQIGSNITFDCVGQDDGTGVVVYLWSLFGSNGASVGRVDVGSSDFTSLSIPDVQFITLYAGVRCVFGIERSGALSISHDADITLVGW